MKRNAKKTKGVVKGGPSGFLISLAVHIGAFLLAGLLVVFTVVQKEEKKFVPPKPVDRPKMKLKKPQVKVKKTAKPKSTTRIVTKVKRADMPDIQLPEMSGMGEGLGGGLGGFEIMPDISEVSLFGGIQTIGNDFVGTFYDLKRGRRGNMLPPMDRENVHNLVAKFFRNDWRPSTFAQYYRSPRKLYTTMFMVPPTQSALAPEAFGEGDTLGYAWLAHYKGQLVYHEDIKFRFWGRGDDVLTVRVDGEIVLEGSWGGTREVLSPFWNRLRADSEKYILGFGTAIVGDWIELKAGEPVEMEVLIGEVPGGVFQCMLCVQVEGVEYPRNRVLNGPTLPAFKTEEPSEDLADAITYHLAEGAVSLTGGPVFRDYAVSPPQATVTEPEDVPVEPAPESGSSEKDAMRVWTTTNGKNFEAEFLTMMTGKVTLRSRKGRQMQVKLAELSAKDIAFIELVDPPEFSVNFLKTGRNVEAPEASPMITDIKPYRGTDYVFGVELEKKGNQSYPHEITVEYFVYADESDGSTYRLLERKSSSFIPTEENGYAHTFKGETVRVEEFAMNSAYDMRGTSYGGYLILVYDERGEIIQYKTSSERLYENRDKLKKIPVGKWFDKNCERVGPPRPGASHRPDWMS